MDHGPLDAEAYFHVRAGVSVIFGLSVAHLLRGIARIVRHQERRPVYPVHLAWVASTFLLVVHFWWWEIGAAAIPHWSFLPYLFLIVYGSMFYFLCLLVFPEKLDPFPDYRAYFHAERKWFFGLLAVIAVADIADTTLKGSSHFVSLGPEYLVATAVHTGLCGVAMFTENERFHRSFVTLNLLYQISWMLRRYNF